MAAGRVIDGDEHDARTNAQRIISEANADADKIVSDVKALAKNILDDTRKEAERITARAEADAAKLRDDARVLANELVRDARTLDDTGMARLVSARGVHDVDDPQVTAAHDDHAGVVDDVIGLVVRATIPGVSLGELVKIDRRAGQISAEVVGFHGEQALLLPLGDLAGVAPASPVWRTGEPLSIKCGDDLLGRALDGLGNPIDGGASLTGARWLVDRNAPPALERPPITAPLATGVRAIDAMLSLGRGQRVGLFASAGVGKTTLLGQIARGADADVIVVCQVGERGRELAELLGDELAPARAKTVVVCATSDAPPLVRLRAVHVATAIAEWFRERRGASVLLLVDSLTRVARAQREVGLSAGEPPARHGYPPSVFALLPRLIERAGATPKGAITALYTVLVAGNDLDEPIADEVRGLVDGHIVLDRRLAQRGHFPPIDVVASVSRLMHRVVDQQHADAAARLRAKLAVYEEHRDLITLGAYQAGRDATVDAAVAAFPAIETMLRQRRGEAGDWDRTLSQLAALAGRT